MHYAYYEYDIEKYVTPMTEEETKKMKDAVKNEFPKFDLETLYDNNKVLSDSECILHLKNKGYLVYKQV
jgi:hypothetical protein